MRLRRISECTRAPHPGKEWEQLRGSAPHRERRVLGGGVKRRNAPLKKLWNLSELVRSDFVPAQSQSPGSQSSSTKFKPAVTPP